MKPETIKYIGKALSDDRDRAANRVEDLIRIFDDPANHPRVIDAINDLKKAEDRLEDFQDWEESEEDDDE